MIASNKPPSIFEANTAWHIRVGCRADVHGAALCLSPLRLRSLPGPPWDLKKSQTEQPLDVAAMQQAARVLEGEHDFSSFRGAGCSASSPVSRRVPLPEPHRPLVRMARRCRR